MSEHSQFLGSAAVKSTDEVHRKRLLKVIAAYDGVVVNQKKNQFNNWEEARGIAAQIKDFALANLPELLEEFESKARANGIQVLWARDGEEARNFAAEIVKKHSIKKAVKSKSMISEEIHLNDFLEKLGVSVIESDLGELIVQLAGEAPYHIVTPAMHKSKEEIGELFKKTLGCDYTADPEKLTGIAREHLRNAYLTADIGITGANFLIAEDGSIHVLENEGNARLSMACPKVHLSIVGIEKILPTLADLELFLPLLATSGTGQQITAYNSIVRGPKRPGEVDGPEVMYLILLDNGRTNLYAKEEFRSALRCIRCGACLNACPVYKTIGGHTYNTPYSGPIGAVITPHLKGMKEWNHLAFASSLCGACTDVCPVKIPLHHLLLLNRQEAQEKSPSFFWGTVLKLWAFAMPKRSLLTLGKTMMRGALTLIEHLAPRLAAKIPKPAATSFTDWWRNRE